MMSLQIKLDNDVVHVWYADLGKAKEYQESFKQILSVEEVQRAERFLKIEHRERYIAAHGILRLILAKYLTADPADLIFIKGNRGKPYLGGLHTGKLQFNLSDSQQMALYAFTKNKEVGIDIEYMSEKIEALELAERFFSANEYKALLQCDPAQRKEKFYQCWVRKEAYLKLIGQGLHFPLSQFEVSLADRPNCLLSVDGDPQASRNSTIRDIDLSPMDIGKHYAAAVGVAGNLDEIVLEEWKLGDEKRCF
jgi:4'-phosphopantetheinyl transferase